MATTGCWDGTLKETHSVSFTEKQGPQESLRVSVAWAEATVSAVGGGRDIGGPVRGWLVLRPRPAQARLQLGLEGRWEKSGDRLCSNFDTSWRAIRAFGLRWPHPCPSA